MATKIRIILVAVLMAATFLCSCRSKKAVTKEISVSQTETNLTVKDSTTHLSILVSSDTTYSNEETTIHQVVYDTGKRDSVGNCPILSVTDVNKKKHSGSKGKKEQTSAFTNIQTSKQTEKRKNISKKNDSQKVVSPVKEFSHFVWGIIIVLLIAIGLLLVKHRGNLWISVKKLLHYFIFVCTKNK